MQYFVFVARLSSALHHGFTTFVIILAEGNFQGGPPHFAKYKTVPLCRLFSTIYFVLNVERQHLLSQQHSDVACGEYYIALWHHTITIRLKPLQQLLRLIRHRCVCYHVLEEASWCRALLLIVLKLYEKTCCHDDYAKYFLLYHFVEVLVAPMCTEKADDVFSQKKCTLGY